MLQLQPNYELFIGKNAELVTIGPDGPRAFKRFWMENKLSYIGCADIGSRVSDRYQQEDNILKLGRMPANCIVDDEGKIHYLYYGRSMSDIPSPQDLLAELPG